MKLASKYTIRIWYGFRNVSQNDNDMLKVICNGGGGTACSEASTSGKILFILQYGGRMLCNSAKLKIIITTAITLKYSRIWWTYGIDAYK